MNSGHDKTKSRIGDGVKEPPDDAANAFAHIDTAEYIHEAQISHGDHAKKTTDRASDWGGHA